MGILIGTLSFDKQVVYLGKQISILIRELFVHIRKLCLSR